MKNKRQKQQPFHVKRTRMKDSIIKCKEIIQNYTFLEHELKKNNYEVDVIESQKSDSCIKTKAATSGHNVQECDLLNNRIGNIDLEQMKNMIKIYQEKKYKETEHQMIGNGLTVQKARKNYVSSRNTKAKTQISLQKAQPIQPSPEKPHKHERTFLKIEVQGVESKKQYRQSQIEECLVAKSVSRFRPNLSSLKKNQSEYNYKQHDRITLGKDGLLLVKTRKRTEFQQSPQQSTKNSRKRQYLYQKMQKLRVDSRMRFNPVYQRRIKSYTDFLWKIMIAHNIYLNLDLRDPFPFNARPKAYIGYGNNCNMIKGLIKRRFWWNVVQQYSQDCYFVWSQLKSSKIYKRQESKGERKTSVVQKDMNELIDRSITLKRKKMMSKDERLKLRQQVGYHNKIFSLQDMKLLENNIIKLDIMQVNKEKYQFYQARTKEIHDNAKIIQKIEANQNASLDSQFCQRLGRIIKPVVHNHLENNFHLGNKKALFYNLRQYYSKMNEDVFQYIPLTFHIRNGIKDIEYKKFVKYYNERKKVVTRLNNQQSKQKARNIWIVKPGENSNRGTGIVVIDQIYELDHILKNSGRKKNNLANKDKTQGNTFIVQMYIDRPFLYNNRKFDIRHYMLITNLYGVTRAYWYQEGYVRTSSYQFNLGNFDPEIHLTNDAIQNQYLQYGKYEPYNKLSYTQLQNYLNTLKEKKYNFKSEILPIMKKIATDSVRSVYTQISPENKMHNFQIFGLDFMIDRDFNPWLIEVNTNPCLDCSCPLLDRIIPYMVEQSLKLSLDVVYPPPSHYPNTSKHYAPFISLQTFRYQLIFDSLSQGEQLSKLYKDNKSIQSQIGLIDDDVVFKDDGKEIKLQDFT